MFIRLLISVVNASNNTKCISLNNQHRIIQPTLNNLCPNEYSQALRCPPFAVNLDRCVGGWSTFNDLPNKVCVPNKAEDF